jgi:hypothetical protein
MKVANLNYTHEDIKIEEMLTIWPLKILHKSFQTTCSQGKTFVTPSHYHLVATIVCPKCEVAELFFRHFF